MSTQNTAANVHELDGRGNAEDRLVSCLPAR